MYEPVMMQPLRTAETNMNPHGRELWMIYAADGTILDAIDTGDVRPLWAEQLMRLPAVSVMPSVWRTWRRDYAAAQVTA